MRYDYVNPKRKIRKHLSKRHTNYSRLYLVFIFAIMAVGSIAILLNSHSQSEASSISAPAFYNENLAESVGQSAAIETALPSSIELEQATDTLFQRSTKESLLREMIEKEGIELTVQEEQYFATH